MYERLDARVHNDRVQYKTNCIEEHSAFRYAWNDGVPSNSLKGKEQERQMEAYFSFQASDGHGEFLSWSNLGHAAYVRWDRRSGWCKSCFYCNVWYITHKK